MITNMYFAEPRALFLLLTLLPVLYLVGRSYRRNKLMLGVLKHSTNGIKNKFVFIAIVLSVMISSLAGFIAKPQYNEYQALPGDKYGEYILLADVSRSMAARPSPNSKSNLEHTKNTMTSIVRGVSSSAKYQIFGYSKLAFSLSSLSNKLTYLEDTINNGIYIESIPERGSDLSNALQAVAYKKLEDSRYKNVSHIILFSDGELTVGDERKIREAVSLIKEAELSVIAVGIGSVSGQRIPMYDDDGNFTGKYEKLKDGSTYIARLNERNLKIIANSTEGAYFSQNDKDELIEYVKSTLADGTENSSEGEYVTGYKDLGWIFLVIFFIALFILLLRAGELY